MQKRKRETVKAGEWQRGEDRESEGYASHRERFPYSMSSATWE